MMKTRCMQRDHIIDMGPAAGVHGGEVVAQGTVEDIKACRESLTGQYLSGVKKIPVPAQRRKGNGEFIRIRGAAQNNLQGVDADIPLGVMTCVTGVPVRERAVWSTKCCTKI